MYSLSSAFARPISGREQGAKEEELPSEYLWRPYDPVKCDVNHLNMIVFQSLICL